MTPDHDKFKRKPPRKPEEIADDLQRLRDSNGKSLYDFFNAIVIHEHILLQSVLLVDASLRAPSTYAQELLRKLCAPALMQAVPLVGSETQEDRDRGNAFARQLAFEDMEHEYYINTLKAIKRTHDLLKRALPQWAGVTAGVHKIGVAIDPIGDQHMAMLRDAHHLMYELCESLNIHVPRNLEPPADGHAIA